MSSSTLFKICDASVLKRKAEKSPPPPHKWSKTKSGKCKGNEGKFYVCFELAADGRWRRFCTASLLELDRVAPRGRRFDFLPSVSWPSLARTQTLLTVAVTDRLTVWFWRADLTVALASSNRPCCLLDPTYRPVKLAVCWLVDGGRRFPFLSVFSVGLSFEDTFVAKYSLLLPSMQ